MSEKRYYWLKLHKDFFKQKEIKRLRRIAGGDVYTIIYLKMLLQSLETDGFLYYDGYYDSFESELADDIDEDEENVKVVISYLIDKGLMEEKSADAYYLIKSQEMTGSEAANARRMRESRLRRKPIPSHCDDKPSLCDGDASHCDSDVTNGDGDVTKCDTEKEIEKEKELEIEKDINKCASVNSDFEYLWALYPNKRGKDKALAAYKRAVKSGTTRDEVEAGINAYIKYINANKIQDSYIKHGSTYFNGHCWKDNYDITGVNNESIFNEYGGISPRYDTGGYTDENII